MDLHSIASQSIAVVNPMTKAKLYKSSGYTIGTNGKQVPSYAPMVRGLIQVQGMSAQLLQHTNNLNISGVLRKVYLGGDWESIVRGSMKGGDKFVFDNETWLVVTVVETWPDWCSVVVQLQVNP